METHTASSPRIADAPTEPPRRRPVRVDSDSSYDPRSHMVAGKHLPLVIGFSYVTAWRLRRRGLFPRPVKLSANRVAWKRADLLDWLAQQEAASK
jgi:predicted DNA-binding transcriptional regulator AlpA